MVMVTSARRGSHAAKLSVRYNAHGGLEPYNPALKLKIVSGELTEGDCVRLVCGDRSAGSPGWRAPTLATEDVGFLALVDSTGKERNRIKIPVSDALVEWSGVDSSGAKVSWGSYSFHVESFDAKGNLMDSAQAEIYADVLEARTDGSSVQLIDANGGDGVGDLPPPSRMT